MYPLIGLLAEAIFHGSLAGASGGMMLVIWEPGLLGLLLSGSDPALAIALYLVVCIEIGITVAMCATMLMARDPS